MSSLGIEGPSARLPATSTPAGPEQRAQPAPGRRGDDAEVPPFRRVLGAMAHEVDQGEATLRSTLGLHHVGGLDSSQMIALQAGIYRYVEVVELASKVVDRGGQAVRTVLSSSGG